MYDEAFHEKIAQISLERFKSLPKSGKPGNSEWTVLSTIVQTFNGKFSLIALATGSKCIGKSSMSSSGDILNDSHAEILCRRAFRRYLYSELSQKNIFDENGSKFAIKSGVHFHFFTTHVPCGDAAIFHKNIEEDCGSALFINRTKRIKLDVYRTGAKCVDGKDPKDKGVGYHTIGAIRTKPGRGDPTLSLSCSDKIAKWCHLGWQGALLSLFIKAPLYVTTFTIAGRTPFDLEAIGRALYGRFESVKLHPDKIQCAQVKNAFEFNKSDDKRSCPSSIIYTIGNKIEVAVDGKRQGVTKKNRNTIKGRLSVSKVEMFRSFLKAAKQFDIAVGTNYATTKIKAVEYYNNFNTFKQSAGVWTEKDANLLQFSIED